MFHELQNHLNEHHQTYDSANKDPSKFFVEDGSNVLFEISRANRSHAYYSNFSQRLHHRDTKTNHHSGQSPSKDHAQYLVKGFIHGVKFDPCGGNFTRDCSLEEFYRHLKTKVGQFRPDSCEKPANQIT